MRKLGDQVPTVNHVTSRITKSLPTFGLFNRTTQPTTTTTHPTTTTTHDAATHYHIDADTDTHIPAHDHDHKHHDDG